MSNLRRSPVIGHRLLPLLLASDPSSTPDSASVVAFQSIGEYVLNSSDIENSLPPPLADLFLEEGLTLPDLGEPVEDTIVQEKSDDNEEDLQQQEQEEQDIAEVKRIEQELQQVSIDEICLGAAAASTSTDRSNNGNTEEILGTVNDSLASTTTSNEGLEDAPATDDLEDLLCDMMIQTSSHFQHSRQNSQGYGHGAITSFRQTTTGGAGYHHHHHHHHHHHQ
uniref:Uncharacterized protein n=1 Tax=Anopheles dirus TaxID=7168 RepID=A0A182NN61_9DIPT